MAALATRAQAAGARRRQAGFTLMEILIAMVILMIGLCGIMAVFPHALRAANSTVEKSYAATISQSVIDAIELGIREMRTPYEEWQGFIFLHDGSEDMRADRDSQALRQLNLSDLMTSAGTPKSEFLTLMDKDYFILLPRHTETVSAGGGGTPIGKPYLFPRQASGENQNRTAAKEIEYTTYDGLRAFKYEVAKIYELGRDLEESTHENEVTQELERGDPFAQYGFAFTIRPTKGPSPDSPNPDRRTQQIVPGLYEVMVNVYRNFRPQPESRYNDPVERFLGYVSAR